MVDRRINRLFAEWNRLRSPGCAVAVHYRGRTVHSSGYGKADLEFRVPIRTDTVFHVASLSKQITGFLVLMLAEEKLLRLDDDIRTYLPWVPRFGITLRQLMHHTSGLRDYFTLMKLSGVRPMDEKSILDVRDLVAHQTALNFRPGTDFNYCNTGWLLLAAAVSAVFADTPFGDIVKHRVFEPLGMRASSVRADHRTLIPRRASAYDTRERPAYWMPNFDLVGATGVHTTADDLLIWARNLIDPQLGGPRIIRQLTTAGRLNDGRSVRYGAGVEIGRYGGLRVIKHRGWDLGYVAHLAVYPQERLAIAIVGNASTLPTEERGRRIADLFLRPRFRVAPRPARELSEAQLDARAGLFRHPRTRRALWMTRMGRELHWASEPDGEGFDLVPVDGRTFRAKTEVMEFVFGDRTLTIREETGVTQRYERVEPWTPTAADVRRVAGTYRSDELDEHLWFEAIGVDLFVRRRRWPERPLVPAYRDSFTDDIATYRFIRRGGRVVAVELTLDRIYRLRYERERGTVRRLRP